MSADYFKTLTPRQQLVDLVHKHAQSTGGNYGDSWRELDRRWKEKYGSALSWQRWKYNQDHQTRLTTPAYVEAAGKMEEALAIGREMTGGGPLAGVGEGVKDNLSTIVDLGTPRGRG